MISAAALMKRALVGVGGFGGAGVVAHDFEDAAFVGFEALEFWRIGFGEVAVAGEAGEHLGVGGGEAHVPIGEVACLDLEGGDLLDGGVAGIGENAAVGGFDFVGWAFEHLEEHALDVGQHAGDGVAAVVEARFLQDGLQLLVAVWAGGAACVDEADKV